MSPFLKFSKFSRVKSIQSPKITREIKPFKFKNFLFIKILLILLLVGSVFLYLMQINSLATKGFKIQELEGRIGVLQDGNKKMSMEAVKLRSMAELNEKIQNLDMVPITEFSYIEATSTGVAKR
ncbi:MAG: hypothetical protein ACOZBH_04160 [Patescibacteria group bacterium]